MLDRKLLAALLVAACARSAPLPSAPADDLEVTTLHAKRSTLGSYFSRVKRLAQGAWNPRSVWRNLPPSLLATLGPSERVTITTVELSSTGELHTIAVNKSSGVPELDEEALRAFRSVTTFGAPPAAIVKNGTVSFRFSFAFSPD